MDLGAPHAGFVIAAYAVSAGLIVALALYVMAKDRALRAEAKRIEAKAQDNDGRS